MSKNNKKFIKTEVIKTNKVLKDILYFKSDDNNLDFLLSSITEYNPFINSDEIMEWLHSINMNQKFNVDQIPINKLDQWKRDENTGDLKHINNAFFSIRGLKVNTNWGDIPSWSQPIIDQSEIGILGIITKKINGILYFLMQAKAEPGNINTYQLSPTVQATQSNYLQKHGGKPILYLEYFFNHPQAVVLLDQLQSEQGARFYKKRNRNIIIRIKDEYNLEIKENFCWLTLGQIYRLVQKDNSVNMDTRSVLSSVNISPKDVNNNSPIDKKKLVNFLSSNSLAGEINSNYLSDLIISSHPNSKALFTIDELLLFITQRKFQYHMDSNLIPLKHVENWSLNNDEIYHDKRKYFSIIGVQIEAINREVSSWSQPIIKQADPGLICFVIKKINGIMHMLVQLKVECGVMDILEIAPTIQCLTVNYNKVDVPYLSEIINRKNIKKITDTFQSEEGGRFYKETNNNVIFEVDESFQLINNRNYIWMTLGQLKNLMKYNNYLNIETRSLITCVNNYRYGIN